MKTELQMQVTFSTMHTVHEFSVGEYVKVWIPYIDQSCTDLLCPPYIVEVVGKAQSLQCLLCKFRVLQRC